MQLESSGVDLNANEAPTMLPAGTRLRPLRDLMVLKVVEFEASDIIYAAWHGRPVKGVVVFVGKGCYPWRYNSDRSKRWESKAFRAVDVKVGDLIDLGDLNLRGRPHKQILIGNELHLICREEDVCTALPESEAA